MGQRLAVGVVSPLVMQPPRGASNVRCDTDDRSGSPAPGRVVLLNGSSSAGKTTLALTLQERLDGPWQHMALDHFRDGMAPRYRGLNSPPGTPGHAGLNVVPIDLDGERVTAIRFGEVGRRVLRGMHLAVAAFARAGNDVIVDDLIWDDEVMRHYVHALSDLDVLMVGVMCPRETVEAREAQRPGRFPGTAVSHFKQIHAHCLYDIEIDTGQLRPHECAERVIERMRSPATAFARLRARYASQAGAGISQRG